MENLLKNGITVLPGRKKPVEHVKELFSIILNISFKKTMYNVTYFFLSKTTKLQMQYWTYCKPLNLSTNWNITSPSMEQSNIRHMKKTIYKMITSFISH